MSVNTSRRCFCDSNLEKVLYGTSGKTSKYSRCLLACIQSKLCPLTVVTPSEVQPYPNSEAMGDQRYCPFRRYSKSVTKALFSLDLKTPKPLTVHMNSKTSYCTHMPKTDTEIMMETEARAEIKDIERTFKTWEHMFVLHK